MNDMSLDIGNDTEVIASKMPANNRYGQNGYAGPSSDMPGKHTTSGFLPQVKKPTDAEIKDTRVVSAEQYAPAHGMRDRNSSPTKIVSFTHRK